MRNAGRYVFRCAYDAHLASASGLLEVPKHHPLRLGDEVRLVLRGAIGLSDVILRIITTYDGQLGESDLAEREIVDRVEPVQKKSTCEGKTEGQKNRGYAP